MANDAIVAIATPPGRGGIGVVRVSGPGLTNLLQGVVSTSVTPRRATRAIFRGRDGAAIDHGLVLYFPAPYSYTGEDVVEFQGHGGPVVLQLVLKRCVELGARLAEPGEFTKRAFLNDKLDLVQAEGVADLIEASTVEAARSAVRSLEGEFSLCVKAMIDALITLRMLVEATLDFPEEDAAFLEEGAALAKLTDLQKQLAQVLAVSRRGRLLREGMRVVLSGPPNVGKSSLLNRLAGMERAIVTEIPGTTRDAIRETVAIRGVPLHLIDTAGLRESEDPVERVGVARSWEEIGNADLVLWICDATRVETLHPSSDLLQRLPAGIPQIRVINKVDLVSGRPSSATQSALAEVLVSAKTGSGIEALEDSILGAAGWCGDGEGLFMARTRHISALESASKHLDLGRREFACSELLAEELRLAQSALREITGEFTADDLLGRIFAGFCIGK